MVSPAANSKYVDRLVTCVQWCAQGFRGGRRIRASLHKILCTPLSDQSLGPLAVSVRNIPYASNNFCFNRS